MDWLDEKLKGCRDQSEMTQLIAFVQTSGGRRQS